MTHPEIRVRNRHLIVLGLHFHRPPLLFPAGAVIIPSLCICNRKQLGSQRLGQQFDGGAPEKTGGMDMYRGLSMGGHGGMWLSIRHQDIFGGGGSMSGGLDIRPFPDSWNMKARLGEYASNKEVWDNHTVINQLDRLKDGSLAIIIDCGADDFFLQVNKAAHEALLKRGIGHDFIIRPGAHNPRYWNNAIDYQVLFFKKFFNKSK